MLSLIRNHTLNLWFDTSQGVIFRISSALVLAAAITIILLPVFVRLLKAKGLIEPVRDFQGLNPSSKQGTPIMGGLAVLAGALMPLFFLVRLEVQSVQAILISTLFFGGIGFLDDLLKAKSARKGAGLSQVQKYFFQVVGSLVILFLIGRIHSSQGAVGAPYVIPFMQAPLLLTKTTWFAVGLVLIVFFTNSTNITDGMDGLLAFPAAVLAITLAVASLFHAQPSNPEVSIVLAALAGAFLGFLWYNSYPASVFLGDTGSLMIGASLSAAALVLRLEAILLIGGFLFVAQGMSSLIQSYFGVALLGRRIFFRAPLHHTFQFSGVSENKIVIRAWLLSLLFAILAICSILIHFD
ncbi:MAG: phospho-N-acetylmuramoyl-pentapeptide-transferase [Planctomycetota bacterium]|nr:phospho-N-acetylmuramoyl-pentapeptide-transferase [Planctomycetota bacterium]MDP7249192.1 phospho-N-acetylmuramoyl-pentapeptide-transferase [Planctomycetota bacterium]